MYCSKIALIDYFEENYEYSEKFEFFVNAWSLL